MICRKTRVALPVVVCIGCTLLVAQDKSARDRLSSAHAQYYTPTTKGLKSFQCDASIDWKAMLTRVTGSEIPDDAPGLKYLQAIHLSVADDLHGNGSLEWNSPAPLPEGKEDAINQTREGLQASIAGFFQTWNAYMNGSMVPLPDNTVTVTKSGEGVHLSGASKEMKFDEDYDKNMLLTQVSVDRPDLKVLAIPTYASSPDGLLVTSVRSLVNQPPSAPQVEATFRTEYAKVDSFQIPSRIVLDVKNTGVIDFALSSCRVAVADWAKGRSGLQP
jgi:hypothetical protein